jgi:GH35 family endo-1,4-beta-xylanase
VDADGMLRRLDRLGELGLPIHLTEISFCTPDAQQRAEALETFLRLAYSHPAVKAIMLWGFWEKRHWLGPSVNLAGYRYDPLKGAFPRA